MGGRLLRACVLLAAALTSAGCGPDAPGSSASTVPGWEPGPPPLAAPPVVVWAPPTASGTPTSTGTPSRTTSPARPSTTAEATVLFPGPCPPLYGPGVAVPVTVTTRTGSVVMTWWHNGDNSAIAYLVGLQPRTWIPPTRTGGALTEAPITWTSVTPPTGCRTVRFTVPRVTRGVTYTLWLDLQTRTPEAPAGISRITLNQVTGVRLP